MEKENNKKQTVFFAVAALIFVGVSAVFFGKILSVIIFSAVLSYLMLPLVVRFEKGCARAVSIICAFFLIVAIILAMIMLLVPSLTNQLSQFVFSLPEYALGAEEFLDRFSFLEKIGIDLATVKTKIFSFFIPKAEFNFGKTFSAVTMWLLTPIITFYFLLEREKIANIFLYFIPHCIKQKSIYTFRKINSQLRDYVFSQVLLIIAISAISALLLLAFSFEYPLVLGIIVGIFNIIPYIGPIVGSIPAVLIASPQGMGRVTLAIVLMVVIQQIDNIIVHPLIIGKTVKVHPLVVLLTVLIGNELFGLWGMVLSVPVYIALKIIAKEIYAYFSEKNLKKSKNF